MSNPDPQFLLEPQRRTPVTHRVDTVVVGGGTAGCAAAIAAARAGASTVLVERFGSLGGCPTVGRCFHWGNSYLDADRQRVLGGLPLEILKRVADAGGTRTADLDRLLLGKTAPPSFVLVDPEIASLVLLEMATAAGVRLMLHTCFCDPIMDANTVRGVVVQNKQGRLAVLAKTVVDASGEADVAVAAGVPCQTNPPDPDWLSTYGLLVRLGNVDQHRFMDYFLSLPAGRTKPEFDQWLADQTGKSVQNLRADWYWRHFLDPQPMGWGVPGFHPDRQTFSPAIQDWFRTKWVEDGEFIYVGTHYFRDLLKQAVDNRDLEFIPRIDGRAEVGFNFDGFSGGTWRHGEVLLNIVNPRKGVDAFDSDHIGKVEVASRRRALGLARFLNKYMPGFENSHLLDTGVQTMPRHIRLVETQYPLAEAGSLAENEPADAVHLAPVGFAPVRTRKIPFRLLIPKKAANLLVAGKSIQGSYPIRSIPLTMAMGQAAGAAAGLAARQGISPQDLDVRKLQRELQRQEVILDFAEQLRSQSGV